MSDNREQVLDLIIQYGGIDGAHHKQWLLDQIVRTLVGGEMAYRQWVETYENGADGPKTYEWDTGISPWRTCQCGCNVFHYIDETHVACNACDRQYEFEAKQ